MRIEPFIIGLIVVLSGCETENEPVHSEIISIDPLDALASETSVLVSGSIRNLSNVPVCVKASFGFMNMESGLSLWPRDLPLDSDDQGDEPLSKTKTDSGLDSSKRNTFLLKPGEVGSLNQPVTFADYVILGGDRDKGPVELKARLSLVSVDCDLLNGLDDERIWHNPTNWLFFENEFWSNPFQFP